MTPPLARWWSALLALDAPWSHRIPEIPGFRELAGSDPLQVRLLVVCRPRSTRVTATAWLDRPPTERPPWEGEVWEEAGAWSVTRDREALSLRSSDGLWRVDWQREAPTPQAAEVREALAEVAPLAELGALAARERAKLRTAAAGWDRELAAVGLVTLDLELEQLEAVEADLRSWGFELSEEGLWTDAQGRSVVTAGRTYYGYLGPTPLSIGALQLPPRALSERLLRALLELRDHVAPQLEPEALRELDALLRERLDTCVEQVLALARGASGSPPVAALCAQVRELSQRLEQA